MLIPPLVKIREVAKFLAVSRQTVHNLIESGDLAAQAVNSITMERRHVRVTRASLLLFYRQRFGHSLERALANKAEVGA